MNQYIRTCGLLIQLRLDIVGTGSGRSGDSGDRERFLAAACFNFLVRFTFVGDWPGETGRFGCGV